MINEELVTEFLHTEVGLKMEVTCHTFIIVKSKISITFEINGEISRLGEIFELDRYNHWYSNKIIRERDEKINELLNEPVNDTVK